MKTSRIIKIFMVAAAALSLASCNKFEDPYTTKGKTALADPSNIVVDADYKQATITWNAVSGAAQYYYEVRNSRNFVSQKGYTVNNSFYIKDLKQLTDYSFAVKAIPAADDADKVAGSNLVRTSFTTADASAYLWEKTAKVLVGDAETGRTATIQYEYSTGIYTVLGWYGYDGYNLVFKVNSEDSVDYDAAYGDWKWDTDNSNCFYWADTPNKAYCFYDGGNGAGYTWFYTPYTEFSGDKDGGKVGCWGWIENATWSEWAIVW